MFFNQKIETAKFDEWLNRYSETYSRVENEETNEYKELECVLNGTFIVKHNDNTVYNGCSKLEAVEKFNSIKV